MSDDNLHTIPSIVPTRDGGNQRSSGGRSGGGNNTRGGSSRGGGGTGIFARLFIVVALTAAAAACAWAWQLQQQAEQSAAVMKNYEQRIKDLEDRLSDTDEGLNQNTAVQAAKIKELYSEVDKLWASAWRKNKAKIAALEKQGVSQGKKLSSSAKALASAEKTLKGLSADMAALNSVAKDLKRLSDSASNSQAEVERVADDINRLSLQAAKLQKRVAANEEWVKSVNAFRRQVNSSIGDLQAAIRTLQAAP